MSESNMDKETLKRREKFLEMSLHQNIIFHRSKLNHPRSPIRQRSKSPVKRYSSRSPSRRSKTPPKRYRSPVRRHPGRSRSPVGRHPGRSRSPVGRHPGRSRSRSLPKKMTVAERRRLKRQRKKARTNPNPNPCNNAPRSPYRESWKKSLKRLSKMAVTSSVPLTYNITMSPPKNTSESSPKHASNSPKHASRSSSKSSSKSTSRSSSKSSSKSSSCSSRSRSRSPCKSYSRSLRGKNLRNSPNMRGKFQQKSSNSQRNKPASLNELSVYLRKSRSKSRSLTRSPVRGRSPSKRLLKNPPREKLDEKNSRSLVHSSEKLLSGNDKKIQYSRHPMIRVTTRSRSRSLEDRKEELNVKNDKFKHVQHSGRLSPFSSNPDLLNKFLAKLNSDDDYNKYLSSFKAGDDKSSAQLDADKILRSYLFVKNFDASAYRSESTRNLAKMPEYNDFPESSHRNVNMHSFSQQPAYLDSLERERMFPVSNRMAVSGGTSYVNDQNIRNVHSAGTSYVNDQNIRNVHSGSTSFVRDQNICNVHSGGTSCVNEKNIRNVHSGGTSYINDQNMHNIHHNYQTSAFVSPNVSPQNEMKTNVNLGSSVSLETYQNMEQDIKKSQDNENIFQNMTKTVNKLFGSVSNTNDSKPISIIPGLSYYNTPENKVVNTGDCNKKIVTDYGLNYDQKNDLLKFHDSEVFMAHSRYGVLNTDSYGNYPVCKSSSFSSTSESFQSSKVQGNLPQVNQWQSGSTMIINNRQEADSLHQAPAVSSQSALCTRNITPADEKQKIHTAAKNSAYTTGLAHCTANDRNLNTDVYFKQQKIESINSPSKSAVSFHPVSHHANISSSNQTQVNFAATTSNIQEVSKLYSVDSVRHVEQSEAKPTGVENVQILAQRLAAALVKLGMVNVPENLLSLMLKKVSEFSQYASHDLSEPEIIAVLKVCGYT